SSTACSCSSPRRSQVTGRSFSAPSLGRSGSTGSGPSGSVPTYCSMPTSMSPEDRLVSLLSHWLPGALGNPPPPAAMEEAGRDGPSADQAEALDALLAALDRAGATGRGDLERLARETLEALALG